MAKKSKSKTYSLDNISMSTKEAAKYLGFSIQYLKQLRCSHQLIDNKLCAGPAYYKVGRKVIYRKNDLDIWFEQFRVERKDITL